MIKAPDKALLFVYHKKQCRFVTKHVYSSKELAKNSNAL